MVEVQSRMLHEGEMGFIRLASTIKLVFLVEILMLVCVRDYSSKSIAKDPEHLLQNSSVMLTPSFGLFLDVMTNCTHPQFTVASVMTFQEPYEWE